MNLEEQIQADLKTAMKAKAALTVEALREINSSFQLAKTQKNAKEFDNQRAIDCISKVAKTYLEISETADKAGRSDASVIAKAQHLLVTTYLPAEISEEHLTEVVDAIMDLHDTNKMSDVIKLTKEAVAVKGLTVDGKLLAGIVKSKI